MTDPAESHGLRDVAAEIISARDKTWRVIDELKSQIRPGMKESEAVALAKILFAQAGASQHWHRPYVRFGRNTLYKFNEPSPQDEILQEKDIFFFDFGPVFDGVEGDAGDTFVVGNDPEHHACAKACRDLFSIVQKKWRDEKSSGVTLYEFARQQCDNMGWQINLNVTGHRIADFPHQVYSKARLDEFAQSPSPHLWILELQIRHQIREFGAFFEDVLF